MFKKSARIYDAMYSWKDYDAEATRLHELIQLHKKTPDVMLLDVACGTGKHMSLLVKHYEVEGLDLDAELLNVARERLPDAIFHEGDMVDFSLDMRYDVITCLFSAIGYAKSNERLLQAIKTMAHHLVPGGLLVVEPWFQPEQFHADTLHALFVDQPDLKISRMNRSRVEDGVSILDFHYLVGTNEGIQHYTEKHELGLFTHAQYMAAFEAAGLHTTYDEKGLDGRGLYIGEKPKE
jgi:ubiquinone/menaquinone biosynthesis C-methylase UbiE